MVDEGYKPNGWLGIMLGSQLYFDFTASCVATPGAFEVRRPAPGPQQGGG